ncbi:MAG: hypothetical protein ABF408_08710 [Bifidobacterium aquikefiri]
MGIGFAACYLRAVCTKDDKKKKGKQRDRGEKWRKRNAVFWWFGAIAVFYLIVIGLIVRFAESVSGIASGIVLLTSTCFLVIASIQTFIDAFDDVTDAECSGFKKIVSCTKAFTLVTLVAVALGFLYKGIPVDDVFNQYKELFS